jgi:hypothetical protein
MIKLAEALYKVGRQFAAANRHWQQLIDARDDLAGWLDRIDMPDVLGRREKLVREYGVDA